MKFFIENSWLIALMLASGGFLIWPEIRKLISGSDEVGTVQTVQLINHKNALILDVREKAEFDGKRIPNSKHIPLSELPTRLKELEKQKEKPIVVNCRGGMRSASACKVLKEQGFTQVFALKGGILAWQQAGLPLEQ